MEGGTHTLSEPNSAWPTIYVISGVSQNIACVVFTWMPLVEGGTHRHSEQIAAWATIYVISGVSQDVAARSGLAAAGPTIYVISGVFQDIARRGFHLAAPGGRRYTYAL